MTLRLSILATLVVALIATPGAPARRSVVVDASPGPNPANEAAVPRLARGA